MIQLSELPVWVQSLLAWLGTGATLTAVAGIIAALIKLHAARKESKSVNTVQISLMQKMVDKLSDTKDLAEQVGSAVNKMSEALAYFEQVAIKQKQANTALANFVLECFNRSNLKPEAKAELQVLANQLFYDDNSAVIEELKNAKLAAETVAADAMNKVAELQQELEIEKQKLTIAQENVKASRRL